MQTTARLITWHGCAIQGGQRYNNCKTEAMSKAAIVDSHLLISILNQMELTRFWTDINQYPGIHCLWETHDMFRNTALQETNRWKNLFVGLISTRKAGTVIETSNETFLGKHCLKRQKCRYAVLKWWILKLEQERKSWRQKSTTKVER